MAIQTVLLVECLDFSAALNTMNHGLVVEILQERICCSGKVPKCFSSYLQYRLVQVMVECKLSKQLDLNLYTTGLRRGDALVCSLCTTTQRLHK